MFSQKTVPSICLLAIYLTLTKERICQSREYHSILVSMRILGEKSSWKILSLPFQMASKEIRQQNKYSDPNSQPTPL